MSGVKRRNRKGLTQDEEPRGATSLSTSSSSQITSRQTTETQTSTFESWLWLALTLDNWLLDFCRPIAMLALPLDWFPLSLPSAGDYLHMVYNVVTPYLLLQLLERCCGRRCGALGLALAAVLVMGASLHLVADSVNHRLLHSGLLLHLPLRENPIMQQLRPQSLVESFELLYFYDERLGHYMWYCPYFALLWMCFSGSFREKSPKGWLPIGGLLLLGPSAIYYWYLITEGQIFPLALVFVVLVSVRCVIESARGRSLDHNGRFLAASLWLAVIAAVCWAGLLWGDPVLRARYPGILYMPEPWAYYSLHLAPPP